MYYKLYCQSQKRKTTNQEENGTNEEPSAQEMNNNCRFHYAKELSECTHIAIVMTAKETLENEEISSKAELLTRRNDRWINSYMPSVMRVWRANMDVQLTIGLRKIVGYMTKYITKSEATMTWGSKNFICRIMRDSLTAGQSVTGVL